MEKGRTWKAMAREALKQTETLQYTVELQDAGTSPVFRFGIFRKGIGGDRGEG
jgi:hypothetical protein